MRRFWHSLKRGDIAAIALGLVVGVFFLYAGFKFPNAFRATGFGPEWQCTQRGRGGPDFCIKKPPAGPAGQPTTPN